MSTPSQLAARVLHVDRRALAVAIADRCEASFANSQRAAWVEAIEVHLDTLAACIEFSSPRLFEDYAGWHRSLPASHTSGSRELETVLGVLEEIIASEFPHESRDVIGRYLQRARNASAAAALQTDTDRATSQLQRAYLQALLAADRDKAQQIIFDAVHRGMPVSEIYRRILQPTQYEVGRLWQTGQISVAQEHFCTSVTQVVISQLQPYFLRRTPSGKSLVATCVGDELHEVGLRFVVDLMEMEGWSTTYLGASTPADAVAAVVAEQNAQVLAASTTLTRNLFSLADLIAVVRDHPECRDVHIIVGGYAFNVDPFLWRRIGADGYAVDASDAIRLCNRFAAETSSPARTLVPCTAARDPDDAPAPTNDRSLEDQLSQVNNELVTAQRELTRANLQLEELNNQLLTKTEALQEADRRKDEFLAMLAHELRGPLGPIQLAANLLQINSPRDGPPADAVETIDRQVKHLARLVSDLLDASRIAHGKIELKRTPVAIADLLARAAEIARPLLDQKKQQLHVKNLQPALRLEADEIRVTQVVANLLTNASRYTPEKGQIWLTADLENDLAIIEVRDNGIGIEKESLPYIFETFKQETRARQHAAGGLGLGLSLVKQLVELHEGMVEAASDGPGTGATFTVKLPAVNKLPAEHHSEADVQPGRTTPLSPLRILIVDDSTGSAKIAAHLFDILGHTVRIAQDGESALTSYDQAQPDMILLDLLLPDMSGIELARRLQAGVQGTFPLLVALTGNDAAESRREAERAGFDEYFIKPADLDTLASLCSHPKLSLSNRS